MPAGPGLLLRPFNQPIQVFHIELHALTDADRGCLTTGHESFDRLRRAPVGLAGILPAELFPQCAGCMDQAGATLPTPPAFQNRLSQNLPAIQLRILCVLLHAASGTCL